MKISLVGYMGVGKSVVAEHVSRLLNIPVLDLDKVIEEREGCSISNIFKTKGELYFRRLEHKCLKHVLSQESFILSTGGGTPVFYDNMELLKAHSHSIFLLAKPAVLAERLKTEKHQRPLIAHLEDEQLIEFIAKHLFERNLFYQKSKFTLNTHKKSPEQVALEIKNLVKD